LAAVTREDAIFWDIKPSSYLTGDTFLLRCSPTSKFYVRFEVFAAETMNNAVFWYVHRVALVRTDVSEELIASTSRVTRIAELGTTLAGTSNRSKLLWKFR
jgi:hypothetical protein